ncbi:MAG: RsbRD N-terminal domain-containing protein, partial [Marinobacter sp.]|nr:RsbRD N-terminal domain-containing protein [Marinobacter sp.]
MKLVQFIHAEMEQLLKDWEQAALEIAPELRGEDSRALEDHAREMLEFITEDLQARQTDRDLARIAEGNANSSVSIAAKKHGSERHNQGLSMLQMIQELRALRVRVMQDWREAE